MTVNYTLFSYYNQTNATLETIATYAIGTTNGWAGPFIIAGLWLLIFLAFSYFNKNDAAVTASAITLIISAMLNFWNNFVQGEVVVLNLALLLLFIVLKPFSSKPSP